MNVQSEAKSQVAILGGGVSGLAAAWQLQQRHPAIRVTLFEAGSRLGGVIQTTARDGYRIEHSADNFLVSPATPWAQTLCDQLGLELLPTNAAHRGAMIYRNGRFHAIPEGLHLLNVKQLASLLTSPLLTWRGKIRVACEPFIRRRTAVSDESLADFATRRLGREMYEYIVQPLVAGIYTADPERLSVAAALPQFVAMEQEHGRLTIDLAKRARRALKSSTQLSVGDDATAQGARYSLFRAPHAGMQAIVDQLESQLCRVQIHKGLGIARIDRDPQNWRLIDRVGTAYNFDAIIVATPGPVTARLLQTVDQPLSEAIGQIEHVTTAVVCHGYRLDQLAQAPQTFGCIIPAAEQRKILAISFSSLKFPDRAPPGHVLVRTFVGGALQSPFAEFDDPALAQLVRTELRELLGVQGEPAMERIVRWPHTTPQYNLGHRDRLATMSARLADLPGLAITGNAYEGIGIPQCVHAGWTAADRVAAQILKRS